MAGSSMVLLMMVTCRFLIQETAADYIQVINLPSEAQEEQTAEDNEIDLEKYIDNFDIEDDDFEMDTELITQVISELRQRIANPFFRGKDDVSILPDDDIVPREMNSTEEELRGLHTVNASTLSNITEAFLNEERGYGGNNSDDKVLMYSEIDTDEDDVKDLDLQLTTPSTDSEQETESAIHDFLDAERRHTNVVEGPIPLDSMAFNVKTNEVGGSPNLTFCGTVNLDKIVDEVLNGLRKDIIKRGLDKIHIPDIHESFSKKVGIINVKGDFTAKEGWAKNLSTVYRTADVIAAAHDNTLTISCGFGLSRLEIGYDKYKAHFLKLGPHGKLNAIIRKNSILLNATVSWSNHTCKTTLNSLSLNQFEGFQVRITGLGPLNWLFTNISNWVFEHFSEQIKDKVEDTLKEVIEEKLQSFNCSKYFFAWP